MAEHPFMPFGAIVAVCDLVDCVRITGLPALIEHGRGHTPVGMWRLLPDEPELSFGDYSPGRCAWLLGNIRALPEPVPAKGALGLWDLDAATLAAVEGQL